MPFTQSDSACYAYSEESELRQCWEETIAVGNEHFAAQSYEKAYELYLDATALAEKLIEEAIDMRAAVAALLVSYHNLSDLYIQTDRLKLAGEALLVVYRKLSEALSQDENNAIRTEALIWGCGRAYPALMQYNNEYPDCRLNIPSYNSHLNHLSNKH